MKVLFTLILIAGLGYWMVKEIQHEQDLQSQLDEAKKEIAAYRQVLGQSRPTQQSGLPPTQQSGVNTNQNWMWGKDPYNPLNAPAVPVGVKAR